MGVDVSGTLGNPHLLKHTCNIILSPTDKVY